MSSKPAVFAGIKSYDPARIPTLGYVGAIDRLVDGDTFLSQLDIGVDEYPMKWIRVYNLLAPELREPRGPEARAAVEEVFDGSRLFYARTLYKSFDRWVAIVKLYPSEQNLATKLYLEYPGLFDLKGSAE